MKKSISVISSANFGVWNIPARGQGYINSHYANIYKYKIESIYQEPLLKKDFYLLHQKIKKGNYNLIFCSIYQLPTNKSEKIIQKLQKILFTFCP